MASDPTEPNTFVFEYYSEHESTETLFHQLTATLTEQTSDITGFRIELTADETIEVPFDTLVDQQSPPEATETDTANGVETSTSDQESAETPHIPSLQRDGLPAQVLSLMLDGEEEPVRTSELQSEFDDEDIDTSRLSQTLASLKRRDLVAAEPDPDDQRANLYWPTERGQQALRQ